MVFEDIKDLKIVTSTINEAVDLIQDFIDVPPTRHYTDKEAYKLLDDAMEKNIEFENTSSEIVFETDGMGRQSLDYKLQCEIIRIIKEKLFEQRTKL